MTPAKLKGPEASGLKFGTVKEFLGLTDKEDAALSKMLRQAKKRGAGMAGITLPEMKRRLGKSRRSTRTK